jgi:transcriptional/translational regulatory protein YebC/TACO1
MGVFKLKPAGLNTEDLELDLIDYGLEDMGEGEGEHGEPLIVLHVGFNDFGRMQKELESKNITPLSAEVEWIPTSTVSLPEEHAQEVLKLVDKLEQDDDVQKVFHNLI